MTDRAITDELFFARAGLDPVRTQGIVDDALGGADDGELYLEYRQSESLAFDDGRLKTASFNTAQGFGLRAVAGEARGFAHASELSEDAIRRAAGTVKAVHAGRSGTMAEGPVGTNRQLYSDANPLHGVSTGGQDQGADRDRRLRPRQGSAGPSGVGVADRLLAGDPGAARRWAAGRRRAAAGAAERLGRWSATATAWRAGPTAAADG